MARKDVYENYIYEIHTLLKQGELFPKYLRSILDGKNEYKLSQIYNKKNYKTDWIDTLEECINALDTIVRNPRKFIVIEEDIVDISLARSVSVESVKHLAQHTNLISSVKDDGMVIPSKILNTSKEESYEIYENRFIYTLLLKTKDFLTRRFDIIKSALQQSGDLEVNIESEFAVDGQKMNFKLDSAANIPFDAVVRAKGTGPSDVERLTRISNIFNDFLSSVFAKEMRSCALVRPPIQRTNVILKDPNFKKALMLWQFVESAENMDFKVEVSRETMELPETIAERYRSIVYLNTILMQSIANAKEAGDSFEKVIEREKELAEEFVTKNIDDFVPDDFPHLKMDLNEVRRIYYKLPHAKSLKLIEISKMNAAIDRCLRQYKINKAKEDSETQRRLIAQQLKEEAEAKKLALREAREEERRKKREEILAVQEARRREKMRILAEKEAESARIEAVKRAEEERILEAVRLENERIRREREAEEEARRIAWEITEREAAAAKETFEREKAEAERLLREEAARAAAELQEQEEKYWAERRELAIRLLIENHRALLDERQLAAVEKLREEKDAGLEAIRNMKEMLLSAGTLKHREALDRLQEEAKTFRPAEEVLSIAASVSQTETNRTAVDMHLRKELLKAQLHIAREKRRAARLEKKGNNKDD